MTYFFQVEIDNLGNFLKSYITKFFTVISENINPGCYVCTKAASRNLAHDDV
jgi:hypothetical protein